MYEHFKGWAEEFDLVPTEQKKMIISLLISRIEIGKDYKISIQLNMDYEQICEGWMNKEKEASAICPIHNTKQKSPQVKTYGLFDWLPQLDSNQRPCG